MDSPLKQQMTIKRLAGIEIVKIKVLLRHQLNWIQSALTSCGMEELLRYLSDETGHQFEFKRLMHLKMEDLHVAEVLNGGYSQINAEELVMMPNGEPAQMITVYMKKAGEEIENFISHNKNEQFTGKFDGAGNLILKGPYGSMIVAARALA